MESVAWSERPSAAARRPGGRQRATLAAVDLGTNNCRLLIARPSGGGFRVIDAFSRIVRLGEGVDRTGLLSETAMARTAAALGICAAKMRRRGADRSRAVATEACRRAGNFEEFRSRIRAETGLEIEVITAGEEARLALSGCAPLLDRATGRALVFDIGGGSTELMWLSVTEDGRPELLDMVSLPLGVVTLAERHGGDVVPPEVYEDMVAEVAGHLTSFEAHHRIRALIEGGGVQMLGSSGTVTTLGGLFQNLPRYDRAAVDGSFLEFADAAGISRWLLGMDCAARAAQPCIGRDRADLVIAGCAVLEAICRMWPVGRLRIADRGVREGILMDLLLADGRPPRYIAG